MFTFGIGQKKSKMAAANVDDDSRVHEGFKYFFTKLQDTFSSAVSSTRTIIDKRTFDKSWKNLDKVSRFCHNTKLNLKNSPPFMLDILPDTHQHLKLILQHYEEKLHILNDCEYFKIYFDNLDRKCKQVIKLFKDSGQRIFDEKDNSRRKLTKLSLIFSHMLTDLKAIFPNGVYIGSNFKITKADAAEFWNQSFGTRLVTPYN